MSEIARGHQQDPRPEQSVNSAVIEAVRNGNLSNYSFKRKDAILPLSDVLGHEHLSAGSLHIETGRYSVDLFVERWQSYAVMTRHAAGVDQSLYTGCVEVRDLQTGLQYRGQTRGRSVDGEIRYKPEGPVEYDSIVAAARDVLSGQREILEEAVSHELSTLSFTGVETLPWKKEESFGGGNFEASIGDLKLSVERKSFLWHSITASRTQGVLSNLKASIHGMPARKLYQALSRADRETI